MQNGFVAVQRKRRAGAMEKAELFAKFIFPLAFVLLFLSPAQLDAQTLDAHPQPALSQASEPTRKLRVLTWNIWMMPRWTFQSPHNKARAEAIGLELGKETFDIICFEKAFDGGARTILKRMLRAQYPFMYGPANSHFGIKINSGVWILSKFALTDYREIQFRNTAGIEWFARKGALELKGTFQGIRFRIIVTHLQGEEGSQSTREHQRVRDLQVKQIQKELICSDTSDAPLIVAGDFDTPRMSSKDGKQETASYRLILDALGVVNGPAYRITLDDDRAVNDLAISNTGRTDELDYIFLHRDISGRTPTATWQRRIFRRSGWDGKRGRQDLSYRYSVAATIDLKP